MKVDKEIFTDFGKPTQEILSSMPHWFIRWGITFIFLVLIAILVLSAFVPYPEVFRGKMSIETIPAFQIIKASTSGRLEVEMQAGSHVTDSTIIGYLHKQMDLSDVVYLNRAISNIHSSIANNAETSAVNLRKKLQAKKNRRTYDEIIQRIRESNVATKLNNDFLDKMTQLLINMLAFEEMHEIYSGTNGGLLFIREWNDSVDVKAGDNLFMIFPLICDMVGVLPIDNKKASNDLRQSDVLEVTMMIPGKGRHKQEVIDRGEEKYYISLPEALIDSLANNPILISEFSAEAEIAYSNKRVSDKILPKLGKLLGFYTKMPGSQ